MSPQKSRISNASVVLYLGQLKLYHLMAAHSIPKMTLQQFKMQIILSLGAR